MKECEHKNLEYFKKTDKVICLDCGQVFYEEFNFPTQPAIPYTPPILFQDSQIYPTVIWNKITN